MAMFCNMKKKMYLFVLNFSYVHKVFGLICLIDMVWECNWCRYFFFLEKMHFHTLSRNLSVTKSWEGHNGLKKILKENFYFFEWRLLPKWNPFDFLEASDVVMSWRNYILTEVLNFRLASSIQSIEPKIHLNWLDL